MICGIFNKRKLDLLSPNIIREYIRIISYSIFAENP